MNHLFTWTTRHCKCFICKRSKSELVEHKLDMWSRHHGTILKEKFLVMDESGKKLISGVRTLDNCYGLVLDVDIVCNSIRLLNEDLWHQRMWYASYKHLSIVSKHESVLGIPKLSRVSNVVCGPCQLGKQTKAKHPGTQTSTTSRPLELLHLDLMG